jgi:hypothetical protein
MKKYIYIFISLLIIGTLAACSGSTAEESKTTTQTDSETQQLSLPPEVILMLGTVKLDETEYAIAAAQAEELLPLWKALRSLSESETAATAEVEALIKQINTTMTAEQLDVIAAMELSLQDFGTVAETLGIELGFSGGNVDPEMRATMQAARESGERPADGPGGGLGLGGGQGRGDGEIDPAARETAIAERGGSRGARLTLDTNFLNALIEFLEVKT